MFRWFKDNYRPGFDPTGLVLFAALMLPNFIWFAVPAKYDILRESNLPGALDTACWTLQAAAVAALVFLPSRRAEPLSRDQVGTLCVLTVGYWAVWLIYYWITAAYEPPFRVALMLCLSLAAIPSAALVYCGWCRKHLIGTVLAAGFALLHILGAVLRVL